MTDELVTIADIANRFGVDVRTVRDRWTHKPNFPKPRYQPSKHRRQWLAAEVDAWATPAERKSTQPTPGSTPRPVG